MYFYQTCNTCTSPIFPPFFIFSYHLHVILSYSEILNSTIQYSKRPPQLQHTQWVFSENPKQISLWFHLTGCLDSLQSHLQGSDFIFQQNSAPAHRAKITQEWLCENCTDFIDKTLVRQKVQTSISSSIMSYHLNLCVWTVIFFMKLS